MRTVFAEANVGSVKAVKIIRKSEVGQEAGQSRGYGFVEMDSQRHAEKAVKRL